VQSMVRLFANAVALTLDEAPGHPP